MNKQPAYVNLISCWLLTFMLSTGKLAGLTDLDWWVVVSPAISVNLVFASISVIRGLLWSSQDED